MTTQITDMVPILEILTNGKSLGVRHLNNFDFDPALLAGMCTLLFEVIVNCMPENKQVEFEQLSYSMLQKMLDERAEYIFKEKYQPEE